MTTELSEMDQRLVAIESLLAKAELLATQLTNGEKSMSLMPTLIQRIASARKLATIGNDADGANPA